MKQKLHGEALRGIAKTVGIGQYAGKKVKRKGADLGGMND